MSWLVSAVLNWLSGKVADLFARIVAYYEEQSARKEIEQKDLTQAEIVEKLSAEVIALQKAGQPIPEALKEKLREESRKLINM